MGFLDILKKKRRRAEPVLAPKAQPSSGGGGKEDVKPLKKAPAPRAWHLAHAVLLSPHVSEKSAVAEAVGVYTFLVARDATKDAIKQAVKDVYDVTPVSVRIAHMQGKAVRAGRGFGRRADWKKAMVALPKGQSIQLHEGV